MKKEIICIGLAIFSLAGVTGLAQDAEAPRESASSSATAEIETDETTDVDGRKERKMRIERRSPRGIEVEEFTVDGGPDRPAVRRRVQIFDDEEMEDDLLEDGPIDVRPRIRVFPRERDLIIRRGPLHREMRIDLEADRPVVRRNFRELRGPGQEWIGEDEPISHLEEAIRHLKKARMPEAVERLEAELRRLRSRRSDPGSDRLNQELRALRAERDALREELRKLREELNKKDSSLE